MITDPPSCLSSAGRTLWASVCGIRDLDASQCDILLLACKQADRAAESREILRSARIVSLDRFGQEKIHPAVQIERSASLACAALVKHVCGEPSEVSPVSEEDDLYS